MIDSGKSTGGMNQLAGRHQTQSREIRTRVWAEETGRPDVAVVTVFEFDGFG